MRKPYQLAKYVGVFFGVIFGEPKAIISPAAVIAECVEPGCIDFCLDII